MFFRLFLLIGLVGFISNFTMRNSSNTQSISVTNEHIRSKWDDIIFMFILILFIIMLLTCLYFQQTLVNFMFTVYSKSKNNNETIAEQVTILHQTSPLKNC